MPTLNSGHLRGSLIRWLVAIIVVVCAAGIWLSSGPSTDSAVRFILKSRRQGNLTDALQAARQLSTRHPIDLAAWKVIADVAEEAGDQELLAISLQELTTVDTYAGCKALGSPGFLEMNLNHALKADEALTHALTLEPGSVAALRLKAQLSGALGSSTELSQTLLKLIQARSFTLDDLVILASTDPFVSEPERLKALQEANPSDYRLLLPLARTAINENRISDARQLLETITAHLPEYWVAQALLGQILSDLDSQQFLIWHSRLGPEADEWSRIWLARGLWLEEHGETQAAARCFHEALQREPELLLAISHLGRCLQLNGEHDVAQAYVQQARYLLQVRDLATRIDEQKNLQWAPELIGTLENLGQMLEAWAWSTILLQSDPLNERLRQKVRQLEQSLSRSEQRTFPDALPGRSLDWSLIALPDWSAFHKPQQPENITHSKTNIRFRDDAAQAGLSFVYQNKTSPRDGGNLIYESTGGGVAATDIDGDSWPDLYFVQSGSLHENVENNPSDLLYRNVGGTHFVDVSTEAGITESAYGQGIAAGDINNDGFPDLFVANIGANQLLLNNGDGTFLEAPLHAAGAEPCWTISTAIADLNQDGLPDLVEINYCEGQAPLTTVCVTEDQKPRACRPTIFEPAPDFQLANQGDGTFVARELVSDTSVPGGRGMGVVIADFDADHRLDLFVANDQSPNHLLLNQTGSNTEAASFLEQGLLRGVGLDRDGFALAFMGVAAGDVNRDGELDLFVTTFSQETPTLFLSQGPGQFTDNTREGGLRAPCFASLGFGTQFMDADRDGLLDLFILNGHIDQFTVSGQEYQMRPQCFRGLSESRFEELPGEISGDFFDTPRLGRALALLDWNRDQKLDFVATDLEQPGALLTNLSDGPGNAVIVRCIGVNSSRDAIGTGISVTTSSQEVWRTQVTAGNGYESSNEPTQQIGIGLNKTCESLQLDWPPGQTIVFKNVQAGISYIAIEGRSELYECPK